MLKKGEPNEKGEYQFFSKMNNLVVWLKQAKETFRGGFLVVEDPGFHVQFSGGYYSTTDRRVVRALKANPGFGIVFDFYDPKNPHGSESLAKVGHDLIRIPAGLPALPDDDLMEETSEEPKEFQDDSKEESELDLLADPDFDPLPKQERDLTPAEAEHEADLIAKQIEELKAKEKEIREKHQIGPEADSLIVTPGEMTVDTVLPSPAPLSGEELAVRKKEGKRSFTCKECGVSFKSTFDLGKHKKVVHTG